jgi:hypothetical protein
LSFCDRAPRTTVYPVIVGLNTRIPRRITLVVRSDISTISRSSRTSALGQKQTVVMASTLRDVRSLCALIILISCAGCAQLADKPTPAVGDYSMAAKSWLGANIEEMIAAWPNPNMRCGSNTIGEAGCAWWRHFQTAAPGGRPAYDYRCEAIARYNEAGVITKIEVNESSNCHRRFGRQLDQMTRQSASDVDVKIEEL